MPASISALAPLVVLALVIVALLPSSSQAAGSVVLVNDTFNCTNYPQPIDLDLVKVTITDQSVRRDGFASGSNCTGRIGRIEINVASGDGVKIGQGAHDLVIGGGYVQCNGNVGDVHQDGIQVMGGLRVTFRSLLVNCRTGTNSAMYINQGASGNGRPTDVVCDGCTLMRGPDRNRALRIGDSLRSGARNSTIVWCGNGPACGGGEAIWFSGAQLSPVNVNNRIVLYGNVGGTTPPPPTTPPSPPTNPRSAPRQIERPVISGVARAGGTLRTSNGRWANAPTRFAYVWQRCSAQGDHCAQIRGATSVSLRLSRNEVGTTIRVVVTARNANGSASAQSAATPRVVDVRRTTTQETAPVAVPADTSVAVTAAAGLSAPASTANPEITGNPQEGELLTASAGGWSGSPTNYEYQWRRCDASGDACDRIADATLSTYTPTGEDVGSTIRVYVKALNATGSARERSLASSTVVAAARETETAPAANEPAAQDAEQSGNVKQRDSKGGDSKRSRR